MDVVIVRDHGVVRAGRQFGGGVDHAEALPRAKNARRHLFGERGRDAHAHTHLHHEARHAERVQAVSQRGLEHGRSGVHPNNIQVHVHGERNQRVGEIGVDPHLGKFAQENIARMDIDHELRAVAVAQERVGDALRENSFRMPGKAAVQIRIKHRHSAVHRHDSDGVGGRIKFDAAFQRFRIGFKPARELVANVKPFDLIAVNARHHRDARKRFFPEHGTLYDEIVTVRQLQPQNGFNGHRIPGMTTPKNPRPGTVRSRTPSSFVERLRPACAILAQCRRWADFC